MADGETIRTSFVIGTNIFLLRLISLTSPFAFRSYELFPDVTLPDGWQWMAKWVIDKSTLYGQTDTEGWAYASTLDGLQESYHNHTTSGEKKTTSLIRRRRWIRARICISSSVRENIAITISKLSTLKDEIDKTLRRKQADFAMIRTFERVRLTSYKDMANQNNSTIQSFVTVMRDFRYCALLYYSALCCTLILLTLHCIYFQNTSLTCLEIDLRAFESS